MSPTIDDDAAVARRFAAGEPDAVREVYRRYRGRLAAVARSLLSDPNVIDDVVQQTFMQAWRASASFDAERSLSAWLYAICRRVCIDEYRRSIRTPEPTATGEHNDGVDLGPSIERTWTVWEIRQAIDRLPAEEREVVRLASLEGHSLVEIALRQGVPIGTVKSRAFRAHRRLAAALDHLAPSGPRRSTPVLSCAS